MAQQSVEDRLRRLEDGRCPVHGIGMVQVGLKNALFIARCPRSDRGIHGTASQPHGPVTLSPEHQTLLFP
jgi:hypothetical protein